MANVHMKIYLTSSTIKEMPNAMDVTTHLSGWLKKGYQTSSAEEDMETPNYLYLAGGKVIWYGYSG